jgi:16S rRNA (uracil1498-N3)-methyltransferase
MLKVYHKSMHLHRFIGAFDLSKPEVEITNPENIKQIKDVLRMKKGGIIILSDGKGTSAEVTLDSISPDKITGVVDKTAKPASANGSGVAKQVNLYLAILKKENFELAVQKAVECGVSNIIPVITERTIKTGLNIPRLEKIILEASEQCGRDIVPILSPILKFENALAYGIGAGPARNVSHSDAGGEKIIFHQTNDLTSSSLKAPQSLNGLHPLPNKGEGTKNTKSVSIFIGPEGGFTDKEINLAKESGYKVASLGPLTLRGETAAIVATYLAVHTTP